MKKIAASLLVLLTLGLSACGSADADIISAQAPTSSVGQELVDRFLSCKEDSAVAIAQEVGSLSSLPFSVDVVEVGPGMLPGFGSTEINGFVEGASFGPEMAATPFIGYVFILAEGMDANVFCASLKDAADLNWNVCVEAEDMAIVSSGQTVFFLMCPASFS